MLYQYETPKIAIVGAGPVGVAAARLTARLPLTSHIVLLDADEDRASAAAVDIDRTLAAEGLLSPLVPSSTWHHVAGADIVVVTAGRPFVAGESTWDDLLAADPEEVERIAFEIKSHVKEAVVIVAADPGELLVPRIQKVTGFPTRSVLGIHGVRDSARFRAHVARETGVSPVRIAGWVLGGERDALVGVPSLAQIDGKPLAGFLGRVRFDAVVDGTRRTGSELAGTAWTTEIHPAHAAVRLVDAVARNTQELLPCTAISDGQYGTPPGTCIALPAAVGKTGHCGVLALDLTDAERDELKRAGEIVADRTLTADE